MIAFSKVPFVLAILFVLFVSTTSLAEEMSNVDKRTGERGMGGELSVHDVDGSISEEINDVERFKPKKCYKKCYKTKKEAKKYCYHPYSIKICYYKKCIKVWVKKHGKRVQVLKCIKKKGYKCSCW